MCHLGPIPRARRPPQTLGSWLLLAGAKPPAAASSSHYRHPREGGDPVTSLSGMIEAANPTPQRTVFYRKGGRAAHGCAAVGSWSRTRTRATTPLAVERRPPPKPTQQHAVAPAYAPRRRDPKKTAAEAAVFQSSRGITPPSAPPTPSSAGPAPTAGGPSRAGRSHRPAAAGRAARVPRTRIPSVPAHHGRYAARFLGP